MRKQRLSIEPNTVLVAMINNKADHARLHEEKWYRIPVENAPEIIKNGKTKAMAFYLTSALGEEKKWKIHHFGDVKRIMEVGRYDLFPEEEALGSTKGEKRYYKIEFDEVVPLIQPIVSRRGHRVVFIPTSGDKFIETMTSLDLNDLFNTSPLEDRFHGLMKKHSIPAERQFFVETADKERYFLDFAIFCRDRHINVECDGDSYHDSPDQVHYDKDRNNELTAKGWSVLRYTTEQLLYKPERVMNKLMRTINKNGGVAQDGDVFLKLDVKLKNVLGQLRLFD